MRLDDLIAELQKLEKETALSGCTEVQLRVELDDDEDAGPIEITEVYRERAIVIIKGDNYA